MQKRFKKPSRGVLCVSALVVCAGTAGFAVAESVAARDVSGAISHIGCFDPGDAEMRERVLRFYGAQAPTWVVPERARLAVDTFAWRGEATVGLGSRAQSAHLTYSFPADGVTWGLASVSVPGSSTGPCDLSSRFETIFGAGNVDLGREYIRQSLAGWSALGGVSYTEVADDGSVMTESSARVATRGDIRIGGASLGVNGVLAYNGFPSPNGIIGVGGGDMLINSSYFGTLTFNNPANDYLGFRNTVTHEHGHGLGLIHVVPCNGTKIMEPFILTLFEGVQDDDARSIGRMNGDRFAGNSSPGLAAGLGNLSTPSLHSVIVPRLSVNGVSGFGNSDEDYFRFTIDETADVTITATPTGGVYDNGQQTFGCLTDGVVSVNASLAGNLELELRDSGGAAVLATSTGAPAGMPESISNMAFPAGTYVIRVKDGGPNPAVNQVVQLYDLEIRVNGLDAAPVAVAGVDKRVEAETNCFFIGDMNSHATEVGAFMNLGAFEWDLDGDGVFEVVGEWRPMVQYVSNGDFEVTLRAEDSNGQTDEDSITVTVYGAQTDIESVEPASGLRGATVPIVITGTNLRNVTSAAQLSVSGSDVTVVGTPVPNAMGSEIAGLSLDIGPGALLGSRNLTVDAGDGVGIGVGVFEVTVSMNKMDLDSDGMVGSSDLAILLASWGFCPSCTADFNGDTFVDSADLAILLASWG